MNTSVKITVEAIEEFICANKQVNSLQDKIAKLQRELEDYTEIVMRGEQLGLSCTVDSNGHFQRYVIGFDLSIMKDQMPNTSRESK